MKQTIKEKEMLEDLFKKKSSVRYDVPYISSSIVCTKPMLGTIEQDVSGHFGRWNQEEFRAKKLAEIAVSLNNINTVLDIGGGNLLASSFFAKNHKVVDVNDYSSSPYFEETLISKSKINEFIDGDFNQIEFKKRYDLIWLSHVLEHQLDIQSFLEKIVSLVEENGYIAIAVPPRKPFIVSGHINLFNPGLLVYRLVLAGIDCSEAKVFQYDGNICIFAKANKIKLPKLNYDIGDIELLKSYFPIEVFEGFNGDFGYCNLTNEEIESIYNYKLRFSILG